MMAAFTVSVQAATLVGRVAENDKTAGARSKALSCLERRSQLAKIASWSEKAIDFTADQKRCRAIRLAVGECHIA